MLRSLAPLYRRLSVRTYIPMRPTQEAINPLEDVHTTALGGYAEEQPETRKARIFKQEKQGLHSIRTWKIDLDNKGCWENELIAGAAQPDPSANVTEHMKFSSKEDAMEFCHENNWAFEVEAGHHDKH